MDEGEFYFYLSYAHSDLNEHLRRFFHDLRRRVHLLTGESDETGVGFMDSENLRLSEGAWDETISNALAKSRVLVSLFSPAYFRSNYCAKEWKYFLSLRTGKSGPINKLPPPLPVLWSGYRMLREINIPEDARVLQMYTHEFPNNYIEHGLSYLALTRRDPYYKSLNLIANSVVERARAATTTPYRPSPEWDAPQVAHPPPGTSERAELRRIRAFLCHSSADKPKVRDLFSQLATSGIEPWLDENSLLPGQDFNLEITTAVRNSDVVIVCFSRSSVTKVGYIQKEMRLVLDVADEQPEGSLFIIPVRLEECDIPNRFKHLHYANLYEHDGFSKLLNALKLRASEVPKEKTRLDSRARFCQMFAADEK
jgi:hypothetical protein